MEDLTPYIRPLIHYGFHFVIPVLFARFIYSKSWKKASIILISTMAVDLDHLFADPIFDPNRCSINFHILHQYWAITLYFILLFFKKTRLIAIGLLFHMFTDSLDCWMRYWFN